MKKYIAILLLLLLSIVITNLYSDSDDFASLRGVKTHCAMLHSHGHAVTFTHIYLSSPKPSSRILYPIQFEILAPKTRQFIASYTSSIWQPPW